MKWEDISDVLTPDGTERLKQRLRAGEKPILIFDYEGSPINLRIRRIHNGKVWAQRVKLYTEEDLKDNIKIVDEDELRDNKNL